MSLNRQIAYNIVLAQESSDLGKYYGRYGLGRKPIYCHANVQAQLKWQGYNPKDGFIFKAIELCQKGHNNFNYYIEARPDQNDNDSFVIIFNTKIDGKRYQCSFHSFNKKLWSSRVGEGRPTHWDHKSSLKTCIKLINYYKL